MSSLLGKYIDSHLQFDVKKILYDELLKKLNTTENNKDLYSLLYTEFENTANTLEKIAFQTDILHSRYMNYIKLCGGCKNLVNCDGLMGRLCHECSKVFYIRCKACNKDIPYHGYNKNLSFEYCSKCLYSLFKDFKSSNSPKNKKCFFQGFGCTEILDICNVCKHSFCDYHPHPHPHPNIKNRKKCKECDRQSKFENERCSHHHHRKKDEFF